MKYPGDELENFSLAHNWKKYFSEILSDFIKGNVLEVGSGLGETTPYLINDTVTSLTAVDPDPEHAEIISSKIRSGKLPEICRSACGTLSIFKADKFDTIIYIDVVEHIKDDAMEISLAKNLLTDSGYLLILAPAIPFLYSDFDISLGHYRRYTKNQLNSTCQELNLEPVLLRYIDSAGAALSAGKKLLRLTSHSSKEILTWDRYFIPISKISDIFLKNIFGRSVIGIWRKT